MKECTRFIPAEEAVLQDILIKTTILSAGNLKICASPRVHLEPMLSLVFAKQQLFLTSGFGRMPCGFQQNQREIQKAAKPEYAA